MVKYFKFRAIALILVFLLLVAFGGFFMTACKDDNGGENSTPVNAPESKPLSLTSSVVTNDSGENVYTINAIVNPDTLIPRWAIVWENPDSEWATGKIVSDYINLELSNGDKTAKLSTKQAFGETAILIATIGQGASEVSVSKRVEYGVSCKYDNGYLNYNVEGYDLNSLYSTSCLLIPYEYNGKRVELISNKLFYCDTFLTSVVLRCSNLQGWQVFAGSALCSAVISGCENIPYGSFQACLSLESVYIGKNVTSIWHGAFLKCRKLSDIFYEGTIDEWNNISKHSGVVSGGTYIQDYAWDAQVGSDVGGYVVHCSDGDISCPYQL